MGIGVGGLISGLDTDSLISQMMDIERRPITVLQQEEAFYQAKISAVGVLKGALSSVQSSLAPLMDTDTFATSSASSSDSSVLSVSSMTGDAVVGEYQIYVTGLAQSQQVSSSSFTASDQTVGTGTLTLKVGSGTAFDITIDSSNDTLAGIASAINAAGTDANAAVIDDGNGNFYLTLASKNSGTANTISLTISDDDGVNTDASGLSSLYFDPATGSMDETQVAANAKLKVNGVLIERSSNSIDDLIDGLTLSVNKVDAANPLTVSVVDDLSSVTDKVQAFITEYNSLVDSLTTFQKYDAATGETGTLQGDGTTRMITSRLQSMLYTEVDGVADEVNGLSALGVSIDKSGKMSLDTAILTTALEDNRTDVTNFFSQTTEGKSGFAVQFDAILEGYVNGTGLLDAKIDGLNASVSDDETQIERLNLRLITKEETLRQQFQALETLLANFETTSGVLSGQLDSLSNLNAQIYKK